MKLVFILFVLAAALPMVDASPVAKDLCAIEIMENERLLEAEPAVALTDFFRARDPLVRSRAILAAARIGNQSVLPKLLPLVADPSAKVRRQVAFALGQIRAKEGTQTAVRLLEDEDRAVRALAIEAIGRIGGLENTKHLLPFLDDADVALREQAALSLALIKDKATVDPLIKKAQKDDPAQWSYVYALYRLADERSVAVLHQVLKQPVASPSTGDPSALLFALKALWSMKRPVSASELEMLLQQDDPRVQQNALDVASASPNPEFCDVIASHFSALSIHSKWKAIDASGSINCKKIAERNIESTNITLRGAAIVALAKLDKDLTLPLLRSSVKDASWVIRWRAAQALSHLTADAAIPLLTQLINDVDSAVRLAALDSLASFMPGTADIFVPLMSSRDFAVRATAADAIGKTGNPAYLPLLLESYRASSEASEVEGRVAILDALAEFHSSDVLMVYSDAVQDPLYTIRRHAIDGLKKLVGSRFLHKGEVKDPEVFLYSTGKVTAVEQERYAADFCSQAPQTLVNMRLEKGTVVIRLLGSQAPLHAKNFVRLASRGFYDGLRIHRVVPNFVIQGGDPRGDGWGGDGEVLMDQFNPLPYKRGMLGMPTAGKDTGGSQFFITHSRQPHLDGNYTIFGEVVSGMQFVDSTEIGDKILKVSVNPSPDSDSPAQQ